MPPVSLAARRPAFLRSREPVALRARALRLATSPSARR